MTSLGFALLPSMGMSGDETLFEIGEIVAGSYEIRSVLGEGGMGRVYGAHDLALNRRVAIKASWPTVDRALLHKEAQALASVRHPGMIDVYGAGTHRGIAFLVMELLYGVNLAAFLEKRHGDKPFDVREALDVLIAVADALAAVHRSGIAHRDVKPANIMLTPNGRIVVMDFGLFQPENESLAVPSGTPEYMAPESLTGTVDPRNAFYLDIYALGITAYELLSGELPFLGDSPAATLARHLEQPPPDLCAARPDLPPRLAALVREMLAKEPLDRPASMEAVAFRLRAVREAASQVTPQAKFTVLVVDDDAALGKLLGLYVLRAVPEAAIVTVEDAEQALTAVRERRPDVMLLDLHMPKMNGIELCMMLRGMHLADQCTIVAVSAGAREADIDLLRQLGITRFVPKGGELGARLTPQLRELYQAWRRAGGASRPPPASAKMPAAEPASAKMAAVREVPPAARVPAIVDPRAFTLLRLFAHRLSNVTVLVFDRSLRLLFAEGGELSSAPRGAARGDTLDDVVAPERAAHLRPLYEAALAGESGQAEVEASGRRFRVQAFPVPDESGQILWGMALATEVGARASVLALK